MLLPEAVVIFALLPRAVSGSALQGLNWKGQFNALLICEGLILSARAIMVLVDYSGDELGGEGNDHSIGNDCQHSNGLQYLQPGP